MSKTLDEEAKAMESRTSPTPIVSDVDELREKLWKIYYGQPITSPDLRSIDHYPNLHKKFLEFENFITAYTHDRETEAQTELLVAGMAFNDGAVKDWCKKQYAALKATRKDGI